MAADERDASAPPAAGAVGGDRGSLTVDVLSSLLLVFVVVAVIFLASGVWPPMVAIESGSMEPNMHKGDLVFVTASDRLAPAESFRDTGIVTHREGKARGHEDFGAPGSVIVYQSPERTGPPIIHRVHFWVEDGENWYGKADRRFVAADSCAELTNCPAPHAGFVTKGDANERYDQANGIAPPVRQGWVTGTARFRAPYLGCLRLELSPNSCRDRAAA